jgi:hypothetical protein
MCGERRHDARPEHRVIVGNDDADAIGHDGHVTVTVAPPPSRLAISNPPPRS